MKNNSNFRLCVRCLVDGSNEKHISASQGFLRSRADQKPFASEDARSVKMSLRLLRVTGWKQVCQLTKDDLMISWIESLHILVKSFGLSLPPR